MSTDEFRVWLDIVRNPHCILIVIHWYLFALSGKANAIDCSERGFETGLYKFSEFLRNTHLEVSWGGEAKTWAPVFESSIDVYIYLSKLLYLIEFGTVLQTKWHD